MSAPPFATATRPGRLRGVVVGAGSLGPYWALELLESPDAELVGWVDLDASRARAAADAKGLATLPTGASVERMLDEQEADFVVNVTAPAAPPRRDARRAGGRRARADREAARADAAGGGRDGGRGRPARACS